SGGPCANTVSVRANGGSIPWMVLRVPSVKAIMVVGERDEDPGAGVLVAANEFVRLPVQQGPLGAQVLVTETRWRPVMFQVVFVLVLSFNVHIAGVPVSGLGHALRTPMRPHAEFCVLIPLRR